VHLRWRVCMAEKLMLQEVRDTLEAVREMYPDLLILWRNSPAGHPHCERFSRPLRARPQAQMAGKGEVPAAWGRHAEMNAAVKPLLKEYGVVYMDVDAATALRPDGHHMKLDGTVDCRHYCMPGPLDHWVDLLHNILLLLNHYSETPQPQPSFPPPPQPWPQPQLWAYPRVAPGTPGAPRGAQFQAQGEGGFGGSGGCTRGRGGGAGCAGEEGRGGGGGGGGGSLQAGGFQGYRRRQEPEGEESAGEGDTGGPRDAPGTPAVGAGGLGTGAGAGAGGLFAGGHAGGRPGRGRRGWGEDMAGVAQDRIGKATG